MASAVTTNASASATTDSGLKRTLASVTQDSAHGGSDYLQPATKRPKRETRLDRLKGKQKAEAVVLKEMIGNLLIRVKDKGVVDEMSLGAYVDHCTMILAGVELDENALAIFKGNFKEKFASEEILLKNLDNESRVLLMSYRSSITQLLAKITKITKAVLDEVHGLPEPSAYAHHKTWRVWQKKDTAILNLRPPTNQGLPIETLHPAFAAFRHDVRSTPPDEWVLEDDKDDVNQVSLALCEAMAYDFESEATRRASLKELLHRFDLRLQVEFHIERTPPLETHSAWPDLYLSARGTTVLLGEIKSEFETGDPYMQVSRSYQALVNHLISQNRASDGAPCILLVVCGPLLTVAAGFFDGTSIIVEPLTDPCTMLPSRYNWREKRLAQVLYFMRKVIRTLSQPSEIKLSPPGTPRIYPTYINYSAGSVDLKFIELLAPGPLTLCPSLLFTAKSAGTQLLVKLVDPKCYSEGVHRTLAAEGLAPVLHGIAHVAGAPSAIIMEYLDPACGWMTLQDYIRAHREIKISTKHPALVKLLNTMKEKGVVHGDLRPNNIMCRAEGQELEIKVVDFDWAGKLGSAKYPAIMNPAIEWPGTALKDIGEDDDETLLMKMLVKV